MRRYIGCPCSLHLAFYALLRAANADLRRPGSQRDREDVGAAIPCASTYYNGRQRIEKTRFAAGARGRVAYVAGLEHTGHHLWHDGVFKQPGPWRNAYEAYDVGDRATTCADDAKLEKALRGDLARTQGDVLLHLPSCSYPCGTAPACVEIKILRRVCPESSRRPPRHRRDACSMAWRCRFLAALRTRTAAPSPRNDLMKNCRVHPTHRLISTQPPATWDPDLPWLAAATEAAGFDVRVILATRRPRDIVRDPYNGFTAGRIATLTRSCRRLEAQLRRLDPRFLVCAPYPDAYANATKLSRFLGVDVRPAVAATFRPSKRDDSGALARADRDARAAFGLLEGCSRALDAVCSSLSY